jgi:hypothetical protein
MPKEQMKIRVVGIRVGIRSEGEIVLVSGRG